MTDHPLTETAAAELWDTHAGDTVPWDDWYGGSRRALTSLLRAAFDAGSAHATTNLRHTPAGRDLIREGIAAARNLEWMKPLMTPGGRIFNPAIPGDELRAAHEDALAREAMQNMRESEQGRELMAEGWDALIESMSASGEFHDVDLRTMERLNPYRAAS